MIDDWLTCQLRLSSERLALTPSELLSPVGRNLQETAQDFVARGFKLHAAAISKLDQGSPADSDVPLPLIQSAD